SRWQQRRSISEDKAWKRAVPSSQDTSSGKVRTNFRASQLHTLNTLQSPRRTAIVASGTQLQSDGGGHLGRSALQKQSRSSSARTWARPPSACGSSLAKLSLLVAGNRTELSRSNNRQSVTGRTARRSESPCFTERNHCCWVAMLASLVGACW